MDNIFFLHQIKRTNGTIEKGIVVKNTFEDAKQSYHAYLGAYAYGHDANTDFVSCLITDLYGNILKPFDETWLAASQEA